MPIAFHPPELPLHRPERGRAPAELLITLTPAGHAVRSGFEAPHHTPDQVRGLEAHAQFGGDPEPMECERLLQSFGETRGGRRVPEPQVVVEAGERTQAAAIAAVAEFGGDENTAWLLSLGRDMSTTSSVRRRALESAARTGASTADLMRVYQQVTDPDTKTAIISALGQLDDRAAVDALLTIARGDESVAARRSAVSALGRSSDPRVKQALAGIVVAR